MASVTIALSFCACAQLCQQSAVRDWLILDHASCRRVAAPCRAVAFQAAEYEMQLHMAAGTSSLNSLEAGMQAAANACYNNLPLLMKSNKVLFRMRAVTAVNMT